MVYRPTVHKLSPEQRGQIDEAIVQHIKDRPDATSACSISVSVERQIGALLPARPNDFYRYVDGGLQRLRRSRRIHWQRDASGQVIWRLQETP